MNFSNFEIDIECPKCKYGISTNLQEIKLETIIICHNCKVEIKLEDKDASAYHVENVLNNFQSQLDKLFKK